MPKFIRLMWVLGTIVLAMGLASLVQAEAPKVQTQVPGYYRFQLGQFEITALYDGAIELDTKLLKNVGTTDLNRFLSRMFVGNPKMQTAVNAYLINTGDHLVLVDAGAAKLFGPSLGFVPQNMKAAGYDPAQVDTVVITHLHPDHLGGLNDEGGHPLFPKACIWVSQADNDFWLSQQIADSSPSAMQPFFKMARDSAAPYLASGQWKTFSEGSLLVPGVQAVKANGHTPGHTAYAVESGGQKLLIWGDLVHAHAVQFARPGVSIEFDIDQKQAIATRLGIMKTVAANKSLVAGMHLPFPGIGHVRAEGKGSYAWVPIEFGPIPKAADQ
jgi:glyoxylase-like metal-dependent hydrolase (beta-lactamase superfamily II)